MKNLGLALVESASAVAALGNSWAEIESLDDASVVAGMARVREHKLNLQAYEVSLAAVVARRSEHEFGDSGLARRNGSATPREFIQSLTGSSLVEATKLARLGELALERADSQSGDKSGGASGVPPVIEAVTLGALTVDAADAIRRGLGKPDAAVTAEELADAAARLIATASTVSPEELLRLARQARGDLDVDAVERGQKQRSDLRYVRRFRRDGMCGGSWLLPEEDGGLELDNALQLILASRTGGPRFPELDASGEPIAPDPRTHDTRSNEQVLADGFAQVFHNGIAADPSVIPGAQRAAVRVIVTDSVLEARAGSALLEDSLAAVTFDKLAEYLCAGGTVGVMFDDNGDILNVGREQRLFTARQRTGLAVRDGGCRSPGCRKPPSWTEAHHIDPWHRDHGRTDIDRGILLCRYHHMLCHNNNWEIERDDGGDYWIIPPPGIDADQRPIEMPSKNPLVTAMQHARNTVDEYGEG